MNKFSIVAVVSILFFSCKTVPSAMVNNYISIQEAGRENETWKLIWEDDFNGATLDTSKWTKLYSGNADWNRHMSNNDACYAMNDGKLFLRGIKNPDTLKDSRPYLTGGIYSKGKFAFQYGKIEIRAKLECAQGAWPAMWMLAEKEKYGAYPKTAKLI